MSHGLKASRSLIQANAPWFNLQNYEILSTASPLVWYQQFAARIDLRRARSLLIGQGNPFPALVEAYATLTDLIRWSGVVQGKALQLFMEGEKWLAPETLSTMRAVGAQGLHVRLMTVGDLIHASKNLPERTRREAAKEYDCSPFELHIRSRSKVAKSSVLCEPVSRLSQQSFADTPEFFLTIDARLPPALITKQVLELLNQYTSLNRGSVVYPKETKAPNYKSWFKSKVLPYIDLCQWLQQTENRDLKLQVGDAALVEALSIDIKQLSDTTKKHANQLTDEFNLTFMSLQEAAISSLREPAASLRRTKRVKPLAEN